MCKNEEHDGKITMKRLANIVTAILLVPFVLVVQIIKWPLKWWLEIGDYLYVRRETKRAKKEYYDD